MSSKKKVRALEARIAELERENAILRESGNARGQWIAQFHTTGPTTSTCYSANWRPA